MELKELRQAKKWTQADLSEISGYTQAYLSRIEKGTQTPSIAVLSDLCDAFGKRLDVFMRAVLKRIEPKPAAKKSSK